MRGRAAAVALIPALTIVAMVATVVLADRTPGGDAPHLIGVELRLAELVRDGELGRAWRLWATLVAPQPPLGYVPGIVAFLVAGVRPIAAVLAMAVPLALAWDALRRLDDGRVPWAGWLAFVASPIVWLYVEQHGRDLVAAAAVLQALSWAHAAAARPREDRPALLAGAWTGVALLTKYTTPVFLALPLLWLVFRLRGRLRGVGAVVLGGLVVAGPWLLVYGERVLRYLHRSTAQGMEAETLNARDPLAVEALLAYPLALKDALGWPGVVAVVVGVVLGPRALPLLAAAGGVAALSTLSVAQDRYALPAFACLAAAALPLGRTRLGAAVALLAFVPQLAGTVVAFRPGAPAAVHGYFDHLDARTLAWPSPAVAYRPVRFDVEGWRVDEVVEALHEVHGSDRGTVGLLLPRLADGPEFGTLLLRAARRGWRWDFASVNLAAGRVDGADAVFLGPLRDTDWPSPDFHALFVVRATPPDPAGEAWLSRQRLVPHATFTLPGGATGTVYARDP